MHSLFDQLIPRENTQSIRWDKYGQDVIPLWVADMDFASPPCVIEALERRVHHPIFGYTYASETFQATIAQYLLKRYDYPIEKEWLVFIPSVVSGLHMVARYLLQAGEHALIPNPAYHHFKMALEGVHHAYSNYHFQLVDGRLTIDLEELKRLVQPNTRLLMLCNPHNPGGTVFTTAELQALADFARARGILICSDEIHADLILAEHISHVPIGKVTHPQQGFVSLMSLNKTFNFPGMGLAWAVIPDPKLRAQFTKDLHTLIPAPHLLAYTASMAAMQGGSAWHEALLTYLRGNLACVEQWVSQHPQLQMAPLEATYLAWIDASRLRVSDSPQDITQAFLQAGVAVSPGQQFGSPHYFRLNFGTSRALLSSALERMSSVIKKRS